MNMTIELTAPDISAYRHGGTGIDFVHRFEAARPGPHVMVSAIVHGNELCGVGTLDRLLRERLRPQCGTLTLAFANVAAYQRFDPSAPDESRKVDEDFNRVWDRSRLDGSEHSTELERARSLRHALDEVDFLLDLHSMQHPTAPLVLCGPTAKGQALARAIGYPGYVVIDAGHAAGRRMRDYAGFSDEHSPKNALLIECGQHWERSSQVVSDQMTLRFLDHFGMLDAAWQAQIVADDRAAPQKVIEITDAVTVGSERFSFVGPFTGMEVLASAGTLLARDGDQEIRTPHDDCVLIMPSRRLLPGLTAVRLGRFVD